MCKEVVGGPKHPQEVMMSGGGLYGHVLMNNAWAKELGEDRAGLFRRHPAHPPRRPDGAEVHGPGERGDPGAAEVTRP